MRNRRAGLLFVLLLLCSCRSSTPPADLVLRGGRIHTADPSAPWAEAIAVRGDTIVAVGSDAEVEPSIGRNTRLVELDGRLVLPGFIDGHIHFLDGALRLEQVRLAEARSLEEMQRIVGDFARAHPDLAWIQGMGWIYSYVDGGRLPTRRDLDAVVSDRPVVLLAYDGHTAWLNSKALELAGIGPASRPLGYGEVVKDPDTGEPTGVLKEAGAIALVERALPVLTREQRLDALRRAVAYAHRFGITSIQNAHGSLDTDDAGASDRDPFDLYEELERRGELDLSVYAAITVSQETSEEELDRIAALAARHRGPPLKAGAVKIVMDGVIESHTAALLEPYSDDPSTAGSPDYTQEEIDRLVSNLDRRGLQIFTHAIGDRAVRMVLDAYEKAARREPDRTRRHRIEHIEVVSDEDVPRFASLGVLASMQPYHASPDIIGVWARNVGARRLPRAFAWRTLRDAGARLVHGSDWPVVTIDPLVGIHAAVTRQDLEGRPEGGWIPEQRLTLGQALDGYTRAAAYASFDEGVKGSLEVGKRADLAVLSEDLFRVPESRIAELETLMTVVGGKLVYVAPGFLDGASLR